MDTIQGQKEAVATFRKQFKSAPWIPISTMQAQSFRERPLKGPILVSKIEIPRPDQEEGEALRSQVWDLYKAKSRGGEKLDPPAPCASYKGEWIGVMKDGNAPSPDMSEHERFKAIEQNSPSDVTLFYLSGGAWFRAGPPGARPLIKQLCDRSGSRVFTFQYRLVPQYTLPTLLLDVLVAYLYLLSPPPGSFHKPIDPEKLILVGESGGTDLHLYLLQFLQSLLRSSNLTIRFNNRDVQIAMPKGCAFISPGCDMALSLPSVKKFEPYDWLSGGAPWLQPNFPADGIWPSNPPRGDLHCDNSALCHPLVDPSTWTDWTGMPPVWIAAGDETYADGIKFLVKNLEASGVSVTFVQYEHMPHVWNVVMPFLPQSKHVMKLWGEACKGFAESSAPNSAAYYVKLGKLETVPIDIKQVLDIPNVEVLRRMTTAKNELAKFVWKGPATGYAKL
ncbi:alpha/beta-hydrolase [Aspergillus sclerotioniger CBS 115572]|uniref:Alpha/beta-hydrolase n=1 Tax=Aspergillus sclerotioniger CBS 115572 TaxID=1450535 RepID=A0A317XC38_9EURO|nr:alpha/beta-hydrolase [Aspergillus sclerotioniger CBS 115572]PWY95177.1 alpha/beta-hydrolase [Aspergillus sclerotioniger CBS 115572]